MTKDNQPHHKMNKNKYERNWNQMKCTTK